MTLSSIAFFVSSTEAPLHHAFTLSLVEGCRRRGVRCALYDLEESHRFGSYLEEIAQAPPDLLCTFQGLSPLPDGKFIWDYLKIPHLAILLDPAIYAQSYLRSPYSIIGCIDRHDVDFLGQIGFHNAFFLPMGVDAALYGSPEADRPYDLVMLGSFFDYEELRQRWPSRYSPQLCRLMDEAVEITLAHPEAYHIYVVAGLLARDQVDLGDTLFYQLCYDVDRYFRGKDRVELVRAMKGLHVHLFGGIARSGGKRGWDDFFQSSSHLTIHGQVSYAESLEVMKKSKICLNSAPFFKGGMHDRVTVGLALGTLPVSTDCPYMRETFADGEEILLYRSTDYSAIRERVEAHLGSHAERQAIVGRGQAKVLRDHTWDERAGLLLATLPPILERMP